MSEHSTRWKFSPDEFDDLDPADGRRGAHRARANPALAVVPVLLVVVAVVAVVVGTMTVLGSGGPTSSAAVSGEQAGEPAGEPAPGDSAAPPAETTPPATQTTAPTPTETAEPEPTADQSVPVTVLNGTASKGLAGRAAARLTAAGWTVPTTDNYRGTQKPSTTTVYYPSEQLAPTAAAVAEALGGATTQVSTAFGADGVTVVLAADYQP
jgi:hypothetical protein